MSKKAILLMSLFLCLIVMSNCDTKNIAAPHDSELVGTWFRTLVNGSPSSDGTIMILNANGSGTITDDSYDPGESDPLRWSTNSASTSLTLVYPSDDNYLITYAYEITGLTLVLSWSEEGHDFTQTYEKTTSIY